MSLVAYGSSDESSDDEGINCDTENENIITSEVIVQRTNDKLRLPAPRYDTDNDKIDDTSTDMQITEINESSEKIHFNKLPKPKNSTRNVEDFIEEDDILPKKEIELKAEKLIKRGRAPVKITVPSLSEFKDLENDNESKINKIKPSNKGTKLFALLPPPKGTDVKSTNSLIPSAVKTTAKTAQPKVQPVTNMSTKDLNIRKVTKLTTKGSLGVSYDSNSEDEDDISIANSGKNSTTDFFALEATNSVAGLDMPESSNTSIGLSKFNSELENDPKQTDSTFVYLADSSDPNITKTNNPQKTLVSNIMNLPKEEILLKNKAEVGPKLPIPEQEYNVDIEGNVAFDDKAIEYLCGRRGMKRKPKEIEEANVIEINGEDIKPDEREWLVKALTEEPVQRPISMQSGGVNSQSKKKHQITYLAHQAKAMEMELKNQWAQNRLTRKQTQSKYGF
ncbi:proline-rich protein PRCC [Ceratina calcarata]|uniref:Proline-rich protein PRCC n=1 Tax=Ceratina calcarata TaxID=156304 RepID=A0AAJ7JBG5_9HYME|nr:proline-rich protein PRCC [Ceratina calcarata]